ncbi:2040_t:CDS:2 [Funneliformis geosporum]|nr:2040_t:CDS:2 [Funneliformis geosporum]
MTDFLLSKLSKDIGKIINLNDECNVTLKIGLQPNQKEFKAHSLILRARSPYFHTALSSNWARTQENNIRFEKPNISPNIFKVILRYIYNGTIDLHDQEPSDMLDILCAADELIIDELIEYIQTYLIQNRQTWIIENLIEILNMVSSRPTLSTLTNLCLEEITLLNPSTFFESESFLNMNEVALVELLKRDDICMKESKLWNCVLKWGIANTPSLSYDLEDEVISNTSREQSCNDTYLCKLTSEDYQALERTLKNCIPLIRFLDIPSNEFNKMVSKSKILPKKLLDDINHYHLTGEVHSTQIYNITSPRSCGLQIDSKIINQKQAAILVNWIDGHDISYPIPYTIKLLFRASEGNNDPKLFHEKCDNVGPTFIVIKIRDSNCLVGGYNPLNDSWKRSWFYPARGQKECFIFSIDSSDKILDKSPKLSNVVPEHKKDAIFDHPWNGPCFGTGPDLWVNIDFNNPIGHAIRKSYQHSIMKSRDFRWEDWEVFSVKKNIPG